LLRHSPHLVRDCCLRLHNHSKRIEYC
jgi:hypothetical protein